MSEASTRTAERALNLLAIICNAGQLNLSESARAAELSPSTALRLIRTLEQTGFVRKLPNGDYSPGSRLIQLGAQALSDDALVTLCRDQMVHLAEATGESVYLSVEGYEQTALYIAIIEGTHSVRHTSWVGRTIPLASSSAGHALLGQVPDTGYVVVERGVEPDVTALASPITSRNRIVAALSIVVPSYRIRNGDVKRYGELLAEAARELSARLGQHTPSDPQLENNDD